MRSRHGSLRRSVIGLVVTGSLALMMGAALVTPLLPEVRAADATVNITGFTFLPHEVTIYAGQTILWTNNDGVPHTVASNDTPASWTEVSIAGGATGVLTLNTPGTFGYHCGLHPVSFHPGMWGVITVLDPSIPEFSSLAFVSFGMLVMFIGIVVASRNREDR
jgi:plastocyanin